METPYRPAPSKVMLGKATSPLSIKKREQPCKGVVVQASPIRRNFQTLHANLLRSSLADILSRRLLSLLSAPSGSFSAKTILGGDRSLRAAE
jgi:hypothetical protein